MCLQKRSMKNRKNLFISHNLWYETNTHCERERDIKGRNYLHMNKKLVQIFFFNENRVAVNL